MALVLKPVRISEGFSGTKQQNSKVENYPCHPLLGSSYLETNCLDKCHNKVENQFFYFLLTIQ